MSLITIQRTPSPPESVDSLSNDEELIENASKNEDFFASKDTVVLQNQFGRRRSSVINEGDTLQNGLLKTVGLLRKEDSICLMISLEKVNAKLEGSRYFCLILTNGKQDTEEYLIVGVDISFNNPTIGFVLPICQDMSVALDGDGCFKLKYKEGEKLFKPSTVHALWSTVQLLNKACSIAHKNNYYMGGLNHTWVDYYTSKISSPRAQIAEWNRKLYADTITNSSLAPKSAIGEFVLGTHVDESVKNKDEIRKHLKEIMRDEDMDNVTVVFLREELQKKVSFNLKEYRSFIAEEILIIYGLMDSASEILPYLYLGSTYNSSNLDELLNNNITHILNVTKESENFFREKFIYKNIEVYDHDDTDLLNHFNDCFQFISEAKNQNSACLVHCQRGISRSASVVVAYMMKEFNLSRDTAIKEVKNKRDCVRPNDGFMEQLKTYEGILKASGNRHNQYFHSDKRAQIKSFPEGLYQIHEKDVDMSSPDSNQNTRSRPVTSQYCERPGCWYNDNSPLTESQPAINEASHDPSLKSAVDIQEDLFVYKPDMISTDQSEHTIDVNDVASKLQYSESLKRQLRLKGDNSWIKPPSCDLGLCVPTRREQICTSLMLEPVGNEADDGHEELCSRKCHSAEFDPADMAAIVQDIDKQPLRPVKELVTKYGHIDK